jgi:hypothetical protein
MPHAGERKAFAERHNVTFHVTKRSDSMGVSGKLRAIGRTLWAPFSLDARQIPTTMPIFGIF